MYVNKSKATDEHKQAKRIAWAYSLILGIWVLIQSGLPYTLIANVKLADNAWSELGVGWFLIAASAWLLYLMLIKYQALVNRDALTGLPNRQLLNDRIIQAIAYANRSNHLVAVVFIDLDNFKLINDSLGHTAGDQLLKTIAVKLQAAIRPVDTLARLGGDEFVLILYDLPNEKYVSQEIDRINQVFNAPFFVNKREIFISYSAGFSLYPQDGKNAETLLMNADVAMYRAKEQSGNSFQFYAPKMHAKINDRLLLESTMRHALEADEFYLLYQPQINLKTQQVFGMEALIRWSHPSMGMISPDKFIPLAEDTGLIVPIGEWIIKTACQQLKAYQDSGLKNLTVAVNLSGRQFKDENLISTIRKILHNTRLAPELLELELTESVLMDNSEQLIAILDQLKSMGLKLAIDDFGTGYSSLSYLKRFPMDKLKIDQSFIKDIARGGDDSAIVKAIIYLGHSLNLQVIAEGIESKAQMDFLALNHCDEGQGFYYGTPLSAGDFKNFVEQHNQPTSPTAINSKAL
jgi:diguanylate cyclase (GGDEF)-like protein